MLKAITSRDNERVKYARKLAADGAFRQAEGLFFAEGARLCLDLAATLPARAVFATEGLLAAQPEALALAEGAGEGYLVAGHVAEKLSGTKTPQGLFALFETPRFALAQLDTAAGILLCEALRDPANVGAVMRSAAGLGFGGVVLAAGCADPYGEKALRASMGAVGRIPHLAGAALGEAAAALRAAGCTLYAAAVDDAARPAGEVRPEGPFALMIGNEGAGLSGEALALSDERVYIPMHNGVESLNAAAAAAVLMYGLVVSR